MSDQEPLTAAEEDLLIELLDRLRWPLSPRVFAALVKKVVSVPIELAVLNDENQILLFYRQDEEYDGFHMPGTVLRDNENVPDAIKRLLNSEVIGSEVTSPIPLGWQEIPRGSKPGQNPTRHEISILHACWLKGAYRGRIGKFFPPDQLPENILSHHRVLTEEIIRRLKCQ